MDVEKLLKILGADAYIPSCAWPEPKHLHYQEFGCEYKSLLVHVLDDGRVEIANELKNLWVMLLAE